MPDMSEDYPSSGFTFLDDAGQRSGAGTADRHYNERLNRGQDSHTAALLAIADGLDELIRLVRPVMEALTRPGPQAGDHGSAVE